MKTLKFVLAGAALAAAVLLSADEAYAAKPVKGPIEIKACGTIAASGSYVLTGNLTAIAVDCLIVTANDVTIDLAGFTITGTDTGGTGGVTDDGNVRDNIAVHNGTIRDFENGVDLPNTQGAVVVALRAVSNTGIGIFVDNEAVVTRAMARDNLGDGVRVGGTSRVTLSTVSDNIGDGIASTREGSTVSGNLSTGNTGSGIQVICPSFVFDNGMAGNTSFGINEIAGSAVCLLSNNMEG